jgi:hypothetical protein
MTSDGHQEIDGFSGVPLKWAMPHNLPPSRRNSDTEPPAVYPWDFDAKFFF